MKTHLRLSIAVLAAGVSTINARLRSGKIHPALAEEFRGIARDGSREVRDHLIALGFLRGKTMDMIECPHRPYNQGHVSSKGMTRTAPNWDNIESLILSEGKGYFESEQQMLQKFAEFRDGAVPTDACAI